MAEQIINLNRNHHRRASCENINTKKYTDKEER